MTSRGGRQAGRGPGSVGERRLPVREIARRRRLWAGGEPGPPWYACLCRFGIATAGNAGLFAWMKAFVGSVFANWPRPVIVYDLGLKGDQKAALLERGVRVCGVPPHLMRRQALFARRPWFLLASTFRYTLFLDATCLVLRPIPEVEEAVRNGELSVCGDGEHDVASRCSPGIAAFYGVPHEELKGIPAFDEGVIGLSPDKHACFLSRWYEGGMAYHKIRGDGAFRDRGPANVAWYSLHKAPPALRPQDLYNNASAAPDSDAAIVRLPPSACDASSEWRPVVERFEKAFDMSPTTPQTTEKEIRSAN